jgi:hypothetical protein
MKYKFSTLLIYLSIYFFKSYSQTGPLSSTTDNFVDLFSGDFRYSVPLLTVPGPEGENYSLNANYHGGIQMEESASWLGLGWDLNPGEIVHNVMGAPDDWNLKISESSLYNGHLCSGVEPDNTYKITTYTGPLYFKDYNYTGVNVNGTMDVYLSSFGLDGTMCFPDYDKYNIICNGINGEMGLKIFDFAHLAIKRTASFSYNMGSSDVRRFSTSKIPQFVLSDVAASNVYPPIRYTLNGINPLGGDEYNGDGYDLASNRAKQGKFVEYFTNRQIQNFIPGFMDFTGHLTDDQRSIDLDLIGAIRITDENGLTYHFSLPVYSSKESSYNFLINDLGQPDQTKLKGLTKNINLSPYVSSYKLTAITGLDYVDFNGDHEVNLGDKGYWISFNYGKWVEEFKTCTPFYNYSEIINAQLHGMFTWQGPSQSRSLYERSGTVSRGSKQIYYLNSIQTQSHTAFFIKEVRNDGISKREPSIDPTDAGKLPIPKLRLAKIILLHNDDIGLVSKSSSMNYSTLFDHTNVLPYNIYKIDDYNNNKLNIDNASLKTIDFGVDYHLCGKLYDNILNTFPKNLTSFLTHSATPETYNLYESVVPENCSAVSQSGKLTLNEIRTYEKGHVSINTPIKLFYEGFSSYDNPNYNPNAEDFWGYYKSDPVVGGINPNVGYLTSDPVTGSKNNADAWSLKKIVSSTSEETLINYDADQYDGITYSNPEALGIMKANRCYLIDNLISSHQTYQGPIRIFHGETTVSNSDLISILNDPNNIKCYKVSLPGVIAGGCGNCTTENYGNSNAYSSTDNVDYPLTVNWNQTTHKFNFEFPIWVGCGSGTSASQVSFNYTGRGFIAIELKSASGGGVRVNNICLRDPLTNNCYQTNYYYEGGKATHEPGAFSQFASLLTTYLGSSDRQCPYPSVGYSSVTVQRVGLDGRTEGKTKNIFNNTDNVIKNTHETKDIFFYRPTPVSFQMNIDVYQHVANNRAGQLNKVLTYDENDNIIASIENIYNKKSSIWELYYELQTVARRFSYVCEETYRLSDQIIYKNGIRSSIHYSEQDPFSGEPMVIVGMDGTQGYSKTTKVPIYNRYNNVGSKVFNVSNTNTINTIEKTTTEKGGLDENFYDNPLPTKVKLTDGAKTIFSDRIQIRDWNGVLNSWENKDDPLHILRPRLTTRFNNNPDDDYWKDLTEITLMDSRNHILESKKSNDLFTSLRYGYNNTLKISESNTSFESNTFSGFEDYASGINYFEGEINAGQGTQFTPTTFSAHTGTKVVRLYSSNNDGPKYTSQNILPGHTYKCAVWVTTNSNPNAYINAYLYGKHSNAPFTAISTTVSKTLNDASNVTVGSWKLISVEIQVPDDFTTANAQASPGLFVTLMNPVSGGTVSYFDDFSIHPIDAKVSNYLYDYKTGLVTATLDNENFATFFEYDASGRVLLVSKETLSGIKKIERKIYHTSK